MKIMNKNQSNSNMLHATRYASYVKVSLLFVGVLLFRLIPFRAPNIEPVLSAQMPISKNMRNAVPFLFAFFSIVVYDMLTVGLGAWTFVTALVYGAIGLFAVSFFKNRAPSRKNFVSFAVVSTILYDVLTGFTLGPIFFNQPFASAMTGQIPFTVLHLAGNVTFAFFLSPLIYKVLQKDFSLVFARQKSVDVLQ